MDKQENRSSDRMKRLQVFAGLMATVFAITLAVIVGSRLSDQALAVLAGAVCGVGAAIPTSLIIVAVSRRKDERHTLPTVHQTQGAYPPVVVVAPPGGQRWSEGWNAPPPSLGAPMQRHFTVVGGAPADGEHRQDDDDHQKSDYRQFESVYAMILPERE